VDDFIDSTRGDPNGDGHLVLSDPKGLKVFRQEDFPWVDRCHGWIGGHRNLPSVMIDNLNIFGTGLSPSKADPPLLVDPNAVLT
jgi:hypothetical protein